LSPMVANSPYIDAGQRGTMGVTAPAVNVRVTLHIRGIPL
jgi:hypothetical protein